MIKIVNETGGLLAILENAFNVGYEKSVNELWRVWFSMPADDDKNIYCVPYAYVEAWENDERVELFRIVPSTIQKSDIATISYECEHVLATLIDDVMFQYHEIGNIGIFTTEVINYVLGHQSTERWVLDACDFTHQFLYKWENENLLGSLFSVPQPFLEPYQFIFDTTVYPWKLSLKTINTDVKSYVRYKKNLKGIKKEIDTTKLCTRLYCLGYGEGVNQLDIKAVNNNKAYLDASTIGQYGIISRIFVDRRFEDAESLKATGQAMLNDLQIPYVTYTVDVADIVSITDDSADKFTIGTYTRIIDSEINEDVTALILSVQKNDIDDVGQVTLTIANKPMDVAKSVSDLADRQRINEVYAQGATNLDSKDFSDNCDATNPAIINFYIPDETVRINKMVLNMTTESFRAYSKAIGGGGALLSSTESGGASSETSSSGGGTSTSTSSGGGGTETSDVQILRTGMSQDQTYNNGGHNHGIPNGTRLLTLGGGNVSWSSVGDHIHALYNHGHQINIPSHSHGFTVPDHSHSISVPAHAHDLDLPNHTHDIEYGIFEGSPLPTAVTLKIDSTNVAGTSLTHDTLDIIPYLAKGTDGKVTRGWHTITATPNDLARITINMFSQIFVQSRGGGNY